MKKKTFMVPGGFGLTTIILCFTMVCIITFSALALIIANSVYNFSKKYETKSNNYYIAEEEAYNLISKFDNSLQEAYNHSANSLEYYNSVNMIMSQRKTGTYEIKDEKHLYHFSKEITDNQNLYITICILYPTKANSPFIEITEWKSVTDEPDLENNQLNLLN